MKCEQRPDKNNEYQDPDQAFDWIRIIRFTFIEFTDTLRYSSVDI